MSFIEVYFNSSLQDTIEISNGPISIGRAGHNQIQIDNKGVSLIHAVMSQKNDDWYIEDLNSTNGTFLNGMKVIGRQSIKIGDTIGICKHNLKFVSNPGQLVASRANAATDDSERTVMMQTSRNSGASRVNPHSDHDERTVMVQGMRTPQQSAPQNQSKHHCQLLVFGETRNINKLLLNKDLYNIGKAKDSDLRVGGWFTPKLVAQISRLGESYYLTPFSNRLVKINGRNVVSRVKLNNDDTVAIKKLIVKFIENE